jgi:membrane protease YdiL (CAAX protease family)
LKNVYIYHNYLQLNNNPRVDDRSLFKIITTSVHVFGPYYQVFTQMINSIWYANLIITKSINTSLNIADSIKIVLGTLVLTIALFGGLVLTLLASKPEVDTIYTSIAISIFVHSFAIISFIIVYVKRKGYSLSSLGFERPTKKLLHVLWQIPLILIGLMIVQIIAFAIFSPSNNPSSSSAVELFGVVPLYAAILLALSTSLLVPVWEEIIFRGVIYSRLRRSMKLVYALIISATIFALAHVAPILFPYLFTMGLAWALLFNYHGTLWAPIIGHAFINSLVTIPLLLLVIQ